MNFFRINMPYGISKNENGEWMAFNRHYLPLGYSKQPEEGYYHVCEETPIGLPVYKKYRGISEKILLELAATPTSIRRDENNEIRVVWFYNDALNPNNATHKRDKERLYATYFEKLALLAECTNK